MASAKLNCTGQNIFQERHLNGWRHLELNFRSRTLVTNILDNKSFDQLPCKTARRQKFLNFVFLFVYIARSLHLVSELTILTTIHGVCILYT